LITNQISVYLKTTGIYFLIDVSTTQVRSSSAAAPGNKIWVG